MAIGLVDPDAMRRAAWAQRLSAQGFPIAWQAATAAEACAEWSHHPPQGLLIAFELPDASGAALLAQACRRFPNLPALLFIETPTRPPKPSPGRPGPEAAYGEDCRANTWKPPSSAS